MTTMMIMMMVVTFVMVLELVLLSLWTRSPVAVSTSIDDVFANTSPDTYNNDDDIDAGGSTSGISSNTYTIDSDSKGIGAHVEILLFEQTTKSDSNNNDDNNDSDHDGTYYHSSHWN